MAWEAAGGSAIDGLRVDRYRIHHGAHLVIPLLHIHKPGRPAVRAVLDLSLDGKVGAAEWPEVRTLVEQDDDILSLDLRGAGETRMRFRTGPPEDPRTAEVGDLAAYASPISGVLANHVYNALLNGRPHFLEMMEDVEIAARFARERLGAKRLAVRARGEAGALAEAAAETLPGIELLPSAGPVFRWSEAVEEMRETWPIQYLLPGGAFVPRRSAPSAR
jgi:hypothetical protein